MSQQPPTIPILWKDPYADKDYGIDLAIVPTPYQPLNGPWLQPGETIVSSNVTSSDSGLIINSWSIEPNATGTLASAIIAWISGGVLGMAYTVRFFFTTSQGRSDVRSIEVRMIQS